MFKKLRAEFTEAVNNVDLNKVASKIEAKALSIGKQVKDFGDEITVDSAKKAAKEALSTTVKTGIAVGGMASEKAKEGIQFLKETAEAAGPVEVIEETPAVEEKTRFFSLKKKTPKA